MADALQKVREIEEEARNMVEEAKGSAKRILQAARDHADELDQKSMLDTQSQINLLKQNQEIQSNELARPILVQGRRNIESISLAGEQKLKTALSLLKERVVKKDGYS